MRAWVVRVAGGRLADGGGDDGAVRACVCVCERVTEAGSSNGGGRERRSNARFVQAGGGRVQGGGGGGGTVAGAWLVFGSGRAI